MTNFGRNMKVTASSTTRDKLHAFMSEGLGCQSKAASEQMQIYVLADGFNIGIVYTEEALSDAQMKIAPWLELSVEDPDAAAERLLKLGATKVEFQDQSHHYLQAPGSFVFRLAKK